MTHAIAREIEAQPGNPAQTGGIESIECLSSRRQAAATQGATP
jgi:hypothetical protein